MVLAFGMKSIKHGIFELQVIETELLYYDCANPKLTSSREIGLDEGLRNIGELSLASVTVMSMETMLVSLRGVVEEESATLNAWE